MHTEDGDDIRHTLGAEEAVVMNWRMSVIFRPVPDQKPMAFHD